MSALQVTGGISPGVTVGHYRILEKVGSGGMGEVFRAHDQHLDRDVAIKALPPGTLGDESARRRFHREALALSKLNHPNIATVHDFDTQQGVDFLVMEYIPGITLSVLLESGPLAQKRVVSVGEQLANGLAAAHDHGVVHHDLKPSNLRVSSDQRLKILDFGLARFREPVMSSAATATLSETGVAAGTLLYMAPEQLLGEPTDARTDIYSAGAVLYEMATGHQPFAHVERSQLIGSILHGTPRRLTAVAAGISAELERIVSKCLEKNPDNRYQSARELAVDLRRIEQGEYGAEILTKRLSRRSAIGTRAKFLFPALIAIGIVLPLFWLATRAKQAPNIEFSSPLESSVAVLPFADLSPGHDHEYFSEGLAEEILNHLTKIPNLRVSARASAFQFKGQNQDSRVVGEKLKVANLLEGSVQTDGNRLRVTVHLTRAEAGLSVWSESYDRQFKDIFAVEDEIANAVSAALQPTLLGKAPPNARSASQTASTEAYQAFLQARYFARRNDSESVQKSLDYVNRAIQLDSDYAPAYALRATMTAGAAGQMGRLDLSQAMESSRRDAERTISLDPGLAAGYLALSEYQAMVHWDWTGAEQSARKARDLAPGDADTFVQLGFLSMCQGRLEEATTLMKQAVSLDPLEPPTYVGLAQDLLDLGRYEEARELLAKAIDLSPNQVEAHESLGEVFLAQGRFAEGLTEMKKEADGPWQEFGKALAFHALGNDRESDVALAWLIAHDQHDAAFQIAQVYAYRGDRNRAFEWLDRACRQRDFGVGRVQAHWLLTNLRQDPRYSKLLKRLNLKG